MSTEAPERTGGGSGLDQAFTKKYGPLPGWAWAGVAAGGGYLYYRHRQNATSAASTASAASTGYTGQPFDYGPSVATLQSEVEALQSGSAQSATTTPATTSQSHHEGGGRPGPGKVTTPTSGANIAGGLVGTPLSQALATLQNNGITVNTVQANGQNVNPANYMNAPVKSAQYYQQGKAGSNFANSVTLSV